MTEDEAREWIGQSFDVSRETWRRLERYVALLLEESEQQNLISQSTKDQVWSRHIADSAQLLLHVPALRSSDSDAPWVDLGAGAGLPGIVVALLSSYRVVMIEMRRKRAVFLHDVIEGIGIANASVHLGKVESVKRTDICSPAAVISARAYAPMERLIASAHHLTKKGTCWLLPKGQNFQNELDIAKSLWHTDASAVQSVTAPDSAIIMLRNVRKRG